MIPNDHYSGATLSRNTESQNDGHQTDGQPVRPHQSKPAVLGAAVEELSRWVEQRESADIANNVRRSLETLDENLVFIR